MQVVIASQNPIKLEAVKVAFDQLFANQSVNFLTCEAASGVSYQPIGNKETLQGAINRAENAYIKYSQADYWVGIEGGVEKNSQEYEAFAWIVIKSKYKISRGKTGTFVLPLQVGKLLDEGKELGEADDIVFGMVDSKKGVGAVGILTQGKITRAKYYAEAVKLALIPFINEDLY